MVWAAAAKIKVTALILNFKLKESELSYILDDSECKLLLYDHDFEDVVGKLPGGSSDRLTWAIYREGNKIKRLN